MRLLPFCIGHAVLLQRCGSPFALGAGLRSADITLPNVLTAVFICSQQPGTAYERLEQRLPLGWRLRGLGLSVLIRVRPWLLMSEVVLLQNYQRQSMDAPEAWQETEGREMACPDLLALRIAAMRLGYSVADADVMPMERLLWEVYGAAEAEGRVRLVNEREQSAMEEARAARLANAAAEKGGEA